MPSTIEALAHFPVSDHDPYARECMIDPYPLHAALRNLGPVVRLRKYDCWAVSRYLDVNSVLLDWETPASGASVGLANFRNDKPWRVPSIILEADPPLHSRTYKIIAAFRRTSRSRSNPQPN